MLNSWRSDVRHESGNGHHNHEGKHAFHLSVVLRGLPGSVKRRYFAVYFYIAGTNGDCAIEFKSIALMSIVQKKMNSIWYEVYIRRYSVYF